MVHHGTTYVCTMALPLAQLVRIVDCCCCWCAVVVVVVVGVDVVAAVAAAALALRAVTPPEPGAGGTTGWTRLSCNAPPPDIMTQVSSLKEEIGARGYPGSGVSTPPGSGRGSAAMQQQRCCCCRRRCRRRRRRRRRRRHTQQTNKQTP
jgi:hypothetical protein